MSNVRELSLQQPGLTRRDSLRLGLGAGLAAALPTSAVAQTPVAVELLIVNACLNPPLRGILESEANVKINDAPFQSSTDVVSRLLAPGGTSRYDVMASISEFSRVPILGEKAGAEKVMALDLNLIPNYSKVAEVFHEQIIERDKKVYGVPVWWGYDSVVFNRDKVPEDDPSIQTWGALFDDKFAGRIAWQDTAHQMMMAAGLFLGKARPETMTKAELDEVGKFLISKKKNVRTLYTSFAQAIDLLASGEVVCLFGPIPVRAQLQQKGFNVTNAWCREGVLSFMHDAFVPKDSTKADKAHAIINSMLGEAFASQVTAASGYPSASTLGIKNLSAADKRRLGYGIVEGTTKHYPLKYPPNISSWIEVWSRVKSA